jgi:hypothetical protein
MMAELTSWAESGETREATTEEIDGGFECGPADVELFNWMFQRILLKLEANSTRLDNQPDYFYGLM